MEKKNFERVSKVVASLLVVALICNFVVDGWQWGPLDFVAMGTLLLVAGLALEYARTTITRPLYRVLVSIGIILALFAIWSELAVDAVTLLLVRILGFLLCRWWVLDQLAQFSTIGECSNCHQIQTKPSGRLKTSSDTRSWYSSLLSLETS